MKDSRTAGRRETILSCFPSEWGDLDATTSGTSTSQYSMLRSDLMHAFTSQWAQLHVHVARSFECLSLFGGAEHSQLWQMRSCRLVTVGRRGGHHGRRFR